MENLGKMDTNPYQVLVIGDSNMVRADQDMRHFFNTNAIKVVAKSGLKLRDDQTIVSLIRQGLTNEESICQVVLCLGINDAFDCIERSNQEIQNEITESMARILDFRGNSPIAFSLYFMAPYLIAKKDVRGVRYSKVNGKLELLTNAIFNFVQNCTERSIWFIPRAFPFTDSEMCLSEDNIHLNLNGILRHFLALSALVPIENIHLQSKFQCDVVKRQNVFYFAPANDPWSFYLANNLEISRRPQFRTMNLNGDCVSWLLEVDNEASAVGNQPSYVCLKLLETFLSSKKMRLTFDDPRSGAARKDEGMWNRAVQNHIEEMRIVSNLNVCVVCLLRLDHTQKNFEHFGGRKHLRRLETLLNIRLVEDRSDVSSHFSIMGRDLRFEYSSAIGRVKCIAPLTFGDHIYRPHKGVFENRQADAVVTFQTGEHLIKDLNANNCSIGAIENYCVGEHLHGIRYFVDHDFANQGRGKRVLQIKLDMLIRSVEAGTSFRPNLNPRDLKENSGRSLSSWYVNWQSSGRAPVHSREYNLRLGVVESTIIDVELDFVGSFNQLVEVTAYVQQMRGMKLSCHGTILIPLSVVSMDFRIYRTLPDYCHVSYADSNSGERRFVAFEVQDSFGASKAKPARNEEAAEIDSVGDVIEREESADAQEHSHSTRPFSKSLVPNSWEVCRETARVYNEVEELYKVGGRNLQRQDGAVCVLIRTSRSSVQENSTNIRCYWQREYQGVSLQPTIDTNNFFPWLLNITATNVQTMSELLPLPYRILELTDSFIKMSYDPRLRGRRLNMARRWKTTLFVRVLHLDEKDEVEFLLDTDQVQETEKNVYEITFARVGAIDTARRFSWFPHEKLDRFATIYEVSNYRNAQCVASSLTSVVSINDNTEHPLHRKRNTAITNKENAMAAGDRRTVTKMQNIIRARNVDIGTLKMYRTRLMNLIDSLLQSAEPPPSGELPKLESMAQTSSADDKSVNVRLTSTSSSAASVVADEASSYHSTQRSTIPKGRGNASKILPSIQPTPSAVQGRGRARGRLRANVMSIEKPGSVEESVSTDVDSCQESSTVSKLRTKLMTCYECAAQQPYECQCEREGQRNYAQEIVQIMTTGQLKEVFIEGYPGTGKSTIVAAICASILPKLVSGHGHAVLLAVTNVAADNLAEKLLAACVRARDVLIFASHAYYSNQTVCEKWDRRGVRFQTVPSYYDEQHSNTTLVQIMQSKPIIVATVALSCDFLNRVNHEQFRIDWMFIDEASQLGILEFLECAMKSDRVVLCGDKHQGQVYAPLERQFLEGIYYKCSALQFCFEAAEAKGEDYRNEHCFLLCGSYRCNTQTCALQSCFWNLVHCMVPLQAEIRDHHLRLLMERDQYLATCFQQSTFSIVHIQGQQLLVKGSSCVNLEEAIAAVTILISLYRTCTRPHPQINEQLTIGVLCIHSAQVDMILTLMDMYCPYMSPYIVEVQTIASCQGRTYDFVVLSLVESSLDDDICCPRLRETQVDDRRNLTIAFSRHKLGMLIVTNVHRFAKNSLCMSRVFSFLDANSLYWDDRQNIFSAPRNLLTIWELLYGLQQRGIDARLKSLL